MVQCKAAWPQVEVVILTTYDDQYIVQGLRAGARGYLLKDADRQTLYAAIRAAARGESLLPPAVADRVVASLASPPSPLSDRESQVLALLVDGKRNKEIAERLVITEQTVKAHVTSIFDKLGVNFRAEAIVVALPPGCCRAKPQTRHRSRPSTVFHGGARTRSGFAVAKFEHMCYNGPRTSVHLHLTHRRGTSWGG